MLLPGVLGDGVCSCQLPIDGKQRRLGGYLVCWLVCFVYLLVVWFVCLFVCLFVWGIVEYCWFILLLIMFRLFFGVLIMISRDISSILSSCFDSDSGPPKKKDSLSIDCIMTGEGHQALWNFGAERPMEGWFFSVAHPRGIPESSSQRCEIWALLRPGGYTKTSRTGGFLKFDTQIGGLH